MTDKRYRRLLLKHLGISNKAWTTHFTYSTDAILHYPFNDLRFNNEVNAWLLRDYNPLSCSGELFDRMRNYRRMLSLEKLKPYKHLFELREL